ncbi:MAG: hypothetical protein FWC42_11045 [Proteobacteria bacterium]|nr:hypothetical protein [Pseudomonadota bacterium]
MSFENTQHAVHNLRTQARNSGDKVAERLADVLEKLVETLARNNSEVMNKLQRLESLVH